MDYLIFSIIFCSVDIPYINIVSGDENAILNSSPETIFSYFFNLYDLDSCLTLSVKVSVVPALYIDMLDRFSLPFAVYVAFDCHGVYDVPDIIYGERDIKKGEE